MHELNGDEHVQLGEYAEELLSSAYFHRLVQLFRYDAMDHILSTKPTDAARREQIYNSVLVLTEFQGMLQALVELKNSTLGKRPRELFPVTEGDPPPANEELSDEDVFALVDAPYGANNV